MSNLTNKLMSFDETEISYCNSEKPDKYSELFKLRKGPIIAKGAGLSYSNAAAINNGVCIDMRNFNRLLSFDEENKFITVESGVCIGDLNNFLVGKGWLLPVLPGYPMITVGGCIAFNVHGKSQYKFGNFLDWVEELNLYHPSIGEIKCSRLENEALFNLTIGGMGFTGIILSAKLKLKKIQGNRLKLQTVKVENITDAVNIMRQYAEQFDYIYSWNNFNCTGKSFGKGIVYLEKIEEGFEVVKQTKVYRNRLYTKKWPGLLNNFIINWMCRTYYFLERLKSPQRSLNLIDDAFPIYGKEIYYHLYGKRGFREYQILFPLRTWQNAANQIQKLIAQTKIGIGLGSLKIFKGGKHHISFAGEGICFTMDVVNNKKGLIFFQGLDKITKMNQGIIYLAKDSRASSDFVQSIFPEYKEFKNRILKFDPEKIFTSELRSRLKI
ncbi:MAG: FAD-binding oxidoreductase [Candidatus Daviesbacteria bacterium]|nr:FAD-binding oxidoreductase [Candidatus Daviesbacteria bacterium]